MHPSFSKFLREDQVLPQLRTGRSVEQWLSYTIRGEYRTITYLSIAPTKKGDFVMCWSESFDEGNRDFHDVVEFSAVDEELNDQRATRHATAEEALAYAINKYGARLDRFVGNGMIQEVYASFIQEKGEASGSAPTGDL